MNLEVFMNEIQAVKHQLLVEKWSAIICECQNSGQNVAQWCEEHQVSKPSYYYWLKKVRHQALTEQNFSPDPILTEIKCKETPRFDSPNTAVRIRTAKAEIEIPNGTDPIVLKQILEAVV